MSYSDPVRWDVRPTLAVILFYTHVSNMMDVIVLTSCVCLCVCPSHSPGQTALNFGMEVKWKDVHKSPPHPALWPKSGCLPSPILCMTLNNWWHCKARSCTMYLTSTLRPRFWSFHVRPVRYLPRSSLGTHLRLSVMS